MSEYHKIDSVFLRDPATQHKTFLYGQWARPEFGYLAGNQWVWTEKIDGTNIRVSVAETGRVSYGGRTDNAQIPAKLVEALNAIFGDKQDRLALQFPAGAILYGEGYGGKIQKGGGNYRPDQGFCLFDVRVGNWWLERGAVVEIAELFGFDIAPEIGRGSLVEMIEWARYGFHSKWGGFVAEGIVARPETELQDRAGRRVITKVKHRDFLS